MIADLTDHSKPTTELHKWLLENHAEMLRRGKGETSKGYEVGDEGEIDAQLEYIKKVNALLAELVAMEKLLSA